MKVYVRVYRCLKTKKKMPHPSDRYHIYEIVTRHLNHTIELYGYKWIKCPEQNPESDIEARLSKLATEYEGANFRDLIELCDWLLIDMNSMYPAVSSKMFRELLEDTSFGLDTIVCLLAWGGLQAVQAIARNKKNGGDHVMLVRNFVAIMLEDAGAATWVRQNGGWVSINHPFHALSILIHDKYFSDQGFEFKRRRNQSPSAENVHRTRGAG